MRTGSMAEDLAAEVGTKEVELTAEEVAANGKSITPRTD
jgi:hypothetical protein